MIPVSTGVACGLTSTNKVLYEIYLNKHNEFEKRFERAQRTLFLLNNSEENF